MRPPTNTSAFPPRPARVRRGPSLSRWAVCSAFAIGFACNRTDNPHEVYVPISRGGDIAGASSRGGAASGGANTASNAGSTTLGGSTGDERGGRTNEVEAGQAGSSGSSSEGGASPTEGGTAGSAGEAGGGNVEPSDLCGPAPVNTVAFTRENLRAAASDCAVWNYCRFEHAAERLSQAVHGYADAPTDANQQAAQAAFRTAMLRWSRVELFQFGPLASNSVSAGKDATYGQGIRDLIFSWPTSARCRVEEQLASRNFATRGMQGVLISARGLFGLEYDLFYPGADSACAPGSTPVKTFADIGETEVAARKREYAVALADDVLAQTRTLLQRWSSDGGNFRQTFVSAAGYPSEQEALNVLGYALVYIEREVKDYKLGVPAGRIASSPVTVDESPFAGLGTENVRENLHGFRALFQGCGEDGSGLGFDDWLEAAGHGELSRDILAAYATAQAAADAFPPLHQATDAELNALFDTVKVLTDLIKRDLLGAGSPLGLKLPASSEGDTD